MAVHGCAPGPGADGGVLAELAAQGAAAEKHRAAAPGPGKDRLLPHMEHAFCHQGPIRAPAEAHVSL